METTICRAYIGVIFRIIWGYIGIMENKTETTSGVVQGLGFRDLGVTLG